jgi:hypothetical protein
VGYTISTKFREKNKQRIVEKDVLDYAGEKSFDTQVKDIFAARLCPSSSHHRGSPSLSDKEIKDKIQFDIKSYFKRFPNIRSTVENKTLKNGMNVRYIVFNGHIELQILTLQEYHILKKHTRNTKIVELEVSYLRLLLSLGL